MLPTVVPRVAEFRCHGSNYLSSYETAIVATLVNEVQARVMIEFGCNDGRTAKALLRGVPSLERYIGIDVEPGHRPALSCQNQETPTLAGIYAAADPRFLVLLKDSRMLTADDLEACNAVFIDGDHGKAAVEHDSRLARELLRPGGVMIWHDYGNGAVQVTEVLDRLHDDEGWPIARIGETWLAFMKT
jgi:predicted O-methyltransferase YrrM